ncbi:MAG TPA: FG-GAP-like repeat-containing protein [Terriglobia bacterium]|nr:FG-GAP-like repeat-containing protein [Terriglobia bacterium]
MGAILKRHLLILTPICVLGLSALSQTPQSVQRPVSSEVILRIIVVSTADEAQRVAERLARGENFVTLAREVSIDTTAVRGGLIGKVSLSALRPDLRNVLEHLPVGQLSPIVQIPTGFAVLKIVPDDAESLTAAASDAVNAAVAASGSVKNIFALDGFMDSYFSLDKYSKPTNWNSDPRKICTTRTAALAAAQESLERDLYGNKVRSSQSPSDEALNHLSLSLLHVYPGRMDAAIQELQRARQIAEKRVVSMVKPLDEALGIAYLHKAQMDNDLFRNPGDRDLLTANGYQPLRKTGDLRKAVEYFQKYLAEEPDALDVKWLLNLAHMMLGEYPNKVPAAYLIPPTVFASAEEVGRFVDVAQEVGLNWFGSAGGMIVDDFDNDGLFDVVTSSMASCAPMNYFHHNANGTFTEQSAKAGLGDQMGGLNMVQSDYNNDGCTDILVLRGGWEQPQRSSLLRNNCNETFTDVTVASGLAQPTSTQAAVWTDIDNDGFVDLFVGNENSPSQLFLNKGNGTFENIAAAAGVNRTGISKGVTAADYDNDGWPDLYVSNRSGPNFFYRNNGNRTFTEIALAAGVLGNQSGFATWFFDYNNDGWADLFLTSFLLSVDETMRTYLGLPHNGPTLKLYKNLGDGSFQDVTRKVGLDKVFMPMGSNFGDFDNDGFLDIYLGTGTPSYAALAPNVLLRNKGGESFVDVTASSGTGELHKGHGVAFADLDNDGNDEIVTEIGGASTGDAHAMRVFRNPGNGNDWINLKMAGTKTSRSGFGARIKITVENGSNGTRVIQRTVGSGGSFGASPLQQHIGLGKAARILEVEVWWPTSKTRQRFTNVEKNQSIEINETGASYKQLTRPTTNLGRGR